MSDETSLVVQDSEETSIMKRLDLKYQRFVHLYLSGMYSQAQLAKLFNVVPETIRMWLSRSEVRKAINEYQKTEDEIVNQSLKSLRIKAMEKMSELMDSKLDAIAYQAARDVLDRTGHKALTKQEINIEVKTFEQQIKDVIDGEVLKDFIDVDCEKSE